MQDGVKLQDSIDSYVFIVSAELFLAFAKSIFEKIVNYALILHIRLLYRLTNCISPSIFMSPVEQMRMLSLGPGISIYL